MRLAPSHTRPCRPAGGRRRHAGFTLVELLVVIGIISILIAIILPSLRKARMAAERSVCLSNMRQITLACLMFSNDHHGYMVSRSGKNASGFDSNGIPTSATAAVNPLTNSRTDISSWIAYSRYVDPVTGLVTKNDDENITYSSIAPYMMGKPVLSKAGPAAGGTLTGLPDSNMVSQGLDKVFRCPADLIGARPNQTGTPVFYRYSYSMNDYVALGGSVGTVNGVVYTTTQRSDFQFNGKLAQIMHPQTVELLICEDELTIDDGVFKANPYLWATGSVNLVAGRHDTGYSSLTGQNFSNPAAMNRDARGNVTFCDGHGEILSRKDALRQKYTASPAPDPVGF